MRDMKKDYVKPSVMAIYIESSESLLESSYVDIGGKTENFNAHRRDTHGIWDELEEK